MELLSRFELPNLILTKDALYHLSYNSLSQRLSYYIFGPLSIDFL